MNPVPVATMLPVVLGLVALGILRPGALRLLAEAAGQPWSRRVQAAIGGAWGAYAIPEWLEGWDVQAPWFVVFF